MSRVLRTRGDFLAANARVRQATSGRAGSAAASGVAILMGNGEAWLSLSYGAALAGAVTVPGNTRFKPREIAFCLRQPEASALYYAERFVDIDFAAMVEEVRRELPAVTGDAGGLTADGRLRMTGRLEDVFRVGGENVAPAEVEEVLLAHPAVETAQVVGVPDSRLGEVRCAYVKLKAGAHAGEEELVAFVRARAANLRAPRYLRIVSGFDDIGMTASGKVRNARLREHAIREFGLGTTG
ncbi:MAG: AMP-binding protein [Burkholderiales bacterium]|nr:AMP-binding protein [Burkholderiales bacterium]